jgi:hypothetical protein
MSTAGGSELSEHEVAPFIIIVVVTLLVIYFFYWLFSNSLFLVRHAEVMIVERWGKYHTTLKPGLHWLWPVMDSPRMIKWRYVSFTANILAHSYHHRLCVLMPL